MILEQIVHEFDEDDWWEPRRPLSKTAQARQLQEEVARKRIEELRLGEEQRTVRGRELNAARSENEKLRTKFRTEGTQTSVPRPLTPFAVFFRQGEADISTSASSPTSQDTIAPQS